MRDTTSNDRLGPEWVAIGKRLLTADIAFAIIWVQTNRPFCVSHELFLMAVLVEVRVCSEANGNLIVDATKDYLDFEVAFDLNTCVLWLVF